MTLLNGRRIWKKTLKAAPYSFVLPADKCLLRQLKADFLKGVDRTLRGSFKFIGQASNILSVPVFAS